MTLLACLKNYEFADVVSDITPERAILYALGVGAQTNELRFTYEADLHVLPTMAVVLGAGPLWIMDPKLGLDWRMVLHGEQRLTLHQPLRVGQRVRGKTHFDGIPDLGPGRALIVSETRQLVDETTGEHIATLGSSAFIRGAGGVGGEDERARTTAPVPDREPDERLDLRTLPQQALLYRLSGDFNPLHIDPGVARLAGFDRPILHGLCSYGFAGRVAVALLCDGVAERLRRFDVRFTAPVYPGETLQTELWRTSPTTAALRVRALERNTTVIDHGLIEYAKA